MQRNLLLHKTFLSQWVEEYFANPILSPNSKMYFIEAKETAF